MSDQKLQDLITDYAKRLGFSSRETDAALTKHADDLKAYARKLRDRVALANKNLEAKHRREEYAGWSTVSQAKHSAEKEEQYASILAEREKRTLPFRLQSVISKAELYESHAKSPALGSNGGVSAEGPIGPPGTTFKKKVPTIDLDDSLRVVLKHIERMEARVDGFLGLCPPPSLTEREKMDLLRSLEGMHSKEIAESFVELGSQRTIEKWRLELDPNCSPSTGLPK